MIIQGWMLGIAMFGLLLNFVAQLIVVLRAYWGIMSAIEAKFTEIGLRINTMLEGDIRELRGRIVKLEEGQSEWIHSLRTRTHDLSEKLQVMVLKVDRLERGPAKE